MKRPSRLILLALSLSLIGCPTPPVPPSAPNLPAPSPAPSPPAPKQITAEPATEPPPPKPEKFDMFKGRLERVKPLLDRVFGTLAADKQRTLYSLDPNDRSRKPSERTFVNWTILGKTELSEADATKALDLLRADMENGTLVAECFSPRHGLTSESGLKLVICFECNQVEIHEGEGKPQTLSLQRGAQETLNAILQAKNIRIAH
jgi:hypothetical protein